MKTLTIMGWALFIIVILFLLLDSVMKLVRAEQSVKATLDLGFQMNHVPVLGAILLLITVLVVIPKTSVIGLILLTAYLGGAVAVNLQMQKPLFSHVMFPAYIGITAWLSVMLRYPEMLKELLFE